MTGDPLTNFANTVVFHLGAWWDGKAVPTLIDHWALFLIGGLLLKVFLDWADERW